MKALPSHFTLISLLLSGWLGTFPVPGTADYQATELPSMGDSAGKVISPLEEKKLGTAFMQQLRHAGMVLDDPEISDYLKSLGQQLTLHSEIPAYGFTFFLVDEPSINAFAGPGGYIGVHAGLLLAAESESELAGVLAHEVAHVTQRHLARAFEASEKLSLTSTAALLAAILIGTQSSEAGQAAIAAVQAGSMQYQINFTRANEKEADDAGIKTLAQAGFDPFGMPEFFDRLQKNARLYGSRPPEFLSTHPVTTNRIAEARARAERYPNVKKKDDLNFQLMRAKLRVRNYDNPGQVLTDIQNQQGKPDGESPAKKYEYALLLSAAGKPRQAHEVLEKLHRTDPDRIAYRLALAEVQQDSRQYRQAVQLYENTLNLYPGNPAVIPPYARALLAAGGGQKAYDLLSDISNKKYNDPQIYKLLAQAATDTGRVAQSHTAMGHYYYLNGWLKEAIEQLQLARRASGLTDYESARIQAQLKEWQTLLEAESVKK